MTAAAAAWSWQIAGETDAPVPAGTLQAISERAAASVAELERTMRPGGLLLVTPTGARRAPERDFPAETAEISAVGLAGVPFETGLARVREAVRGPGTRTVVLDAPDLMQLDGDVVDGLRLRQEIEHLRGGHPDTRFVAYVSPFSFTARHAEPGTLLIHPDPAPATAGDAEGTDVTGALKSGDLPEIAGALRELVIAVDGDLLEASAALRADPLFEQARGELHEGLNTALRQHWPGSAAPVVGTATGLGSPRLSALLYHALGRRGATRRSTGLLRGIDVGRWFCALRADRYETMALVAASLAGEDLSGINLSHAPPLEFCDLRYADLSGTDAYRINCANGDLSHAHLVGACLSRGHFKQASLRSADLRGADVSYASLEQADLTGARLEGTDLNRCHLDHITGIAEPRAARPG